MMKHFFIAAMAALLFPCAQSAEPVEALVLNGLERSFDLKVERSRLSQAARLRWNAWTRLLPTLSVTGGRSFGRTESYSSGALSADRSWSSSLLLNAGWQIWDNMDSVTNIQRATIQEDSQKNSSYMKIQRYILQTLEVTFNFELLKKRKEIETRRLEENKKVLEQTRQLLDAGVKTRMDVLDVEIQVVDAERSLAEISAQNDIGAQDLLFIYNNDDTLPPEIDLFSLTPYYQKKFEEMYGDFKENWRGHYLDRHYEVRNLLNGVESGRLTLRQARMGYFPQLSINLTEQWDYSRKIRDTGNEPGEDGVLRATSLGFTLTWTLWDWFATPNTILNQQSEFEIANTEFRRGRRDIEREIANTIAQYELNVLQVKAAALSTEKSNTWVYHTQERFKLGRVTNMELQRAINQTYQANVNLATFLKEKYLLMARLLYHMGADLVPEMVAVPWR